MEDLLKGKKVILSITDCDVDCMVIVNKADYAIASDTMEKIKQEWYDSDDKTDVVELYYNALMELEIELLMANYEEI